MRSDGTSRASPAGSSTPTGSGSPTEAHALDVVRTALQEIEYGSVLITIHQGEVVGIETSTKVRLKAT